MIIVWTYGAINQDGGQHNSFFWTWTSTPISITGNRVAKIIFLSGEVSNKLHYITDGTNQF